MYYPIQIPYILNKAFSEAVEYTEEIEERFKDFLICFWQMQPKSNNTETVENIIITDGCIDLVADFEGKQIGFVGMSKTNFEFKINAPYCSYGARMKPGAFYALTGISATDAMDNFIPISAFDGDFDAEHFFSLPFDEAKLVFKDYFSKLIGKKIADEYIELFDEFNNNSPTAVEQIYDRLNFSPKQCQRLFKRHFGLSPQMVLCILRFQKCLEILTSGKSTPSDVLNAVSYYDQSHFINDFKRNIGLTPFELVRKYI